MSSDNETKSQNGSSDHKWVVETTRRYVSFPREFAQTPEEAVSICLLSNRIFEWEVQDAIAYLDKPGQRVNLTKNGNRYRTNVS